MAPHENRLAASTSPYLLQHAHNPVDWYPWGDEALARAKAEDRPILLSIGYAACHWCHVMERESFEDEAIARRMNELFVCVKVDREERPDLDQVYQLVVQLMGRSGGWPLTVFLTPDQRPFFAGTYFPPVDRHGMPGLPKVLDAVASAYRTQREEVVDQANQLTSAIGRVLRTPVGGERVGPDLLARASRKLLSHFDEGHGGFGSRPKFPNTMALEVLLRRGALEGDAASLRAARRALERMQAGGIHDQLRGGFHRYSTDERWLVPHFEKMLYDNALLLRLYSDGYRVFDADPSFAETARNVVGYLFAEMRDPSGAFYASQDADSEGEEGKFFVWTPAELRAAVGDDALAYDAARLVFGVSDDGNFEGSGASVLSRARSVESVAITLGEAPSAVLSALGRAKEKLLRAREERPRPTRDDKILASWNGLVISALAEAGRALGEPSHVEAAARAFDAIEEHLVSNGRVRRYFKDGRAADAPGFLDDHANVANAALDLYEATGEPRYVERARAIADELLAHFGDDEDGGFFYTRDDGPQLITRGKDAFDNATPSGSSMTAGLLLRLGALVDERYAERARRQLDALGPAAVEDPFGHAQTVCALDRLVRGSVDVVLVGDPSSAAFDSMRSAVYSRWLPNRSLVTVDPSRPETIEAAPLLARDKPGKPGKVVAYVCRGRTCSAPIDDPDALATMLG